MDFEYNDILIWLISYSKCSTLVENVDNGGSDQYIQLGGIWYMYLLLNIAVNL